MYINITFKTHLLISKYFWCTGSYSSHVTLRNLFLSLDPESGLSSWSFGSLTHETKQIYNFILQKNKINNHARKTNVSSGEFISFPRILFVYKAHLSFTTTDKDIFSTPLLLPVTSQTTLCRRHKQGNPKSVF